MTFRASILAFVFTVSAVTHALADTPKAINVPSGELTEALETLAKQCGVDVIYPSAQLKGLKTQGVRGTLEPREAFRKLIEGTSLVIQEQGSAVLISFRRTSAASGTEPSTQYSAHALPDRIRVAQAEPSSSASEQQSTQDARNAQIQQIDEILVTGSRLKVRADEGPAPVTVFTRKKLDGLGVSTVSDMLRYLPSQPYLKESQSATGAQYVEMRGLGVDTTLVLLNGRRIAPTAADVARNAVDLNSIPLSAVERVEVLSDSASAVYGADAVGGVINIILKSNIDRPALDLSFGTARGGAEERRASFSAGYSSDRLRTSFIADFFELGSLLGSDRDRFSNQDFRRFGGADMRSLNANPGNVTSTTPANLPGLPSRVAAVPVGSTGVGLTPTSFSATAGRQNYESLNRYLTILPESERYTAAAFLEFDLAPTLTLFSELLYSDRSAEYQSTPPAVSGLVVPTANPFNPFGVAVTSNFLLTTIGPRLTFSESEMYRGVVGLRGEIRDWSWEVSGLYSTDDSELWNENVVDTARLSAALSATNPALALNVFQDGPGGSAELLNSLRATRASQATAGVSDGTQGNAFVRGPLIELPAGDLQVVIGGEWREEERALRTPTLAISADRTVKAAFAEMHVPIIGEASGIPALRELTATFAGRYDEYSDFGESFNAQYGLVWKPVRDVLLRASYGTAFRPPSLVELYAPRTQVPRPIADPRRNGQSTIVTTTVGGNPSLEPTEGDSRTFGFVYAPTAMPGLRATASYWRVNLDRRVTSLAPTVLLQNESLFPGRVVRATPTAADVAAGLPGVLLSLDSSTVNFGRLDTAGIDAEVSYQFETSVGNFAPSLSATWVDKYATTDVPNTPFVDRVGIARAAGTIVRWRGIASLGWNLGPWGVSLTARHIPSYDDANLFGQVTGRSVDAQTLMDVQASFAVDQPGIWDGLRIVAGASNIFDEEAPFSQMSSDGYDPSQGQLRQRFGYLCVSKSF